MRKGREGGGHDGPAETSCVLCRLSRPLRRSTIGELPRTQHMLFFASKIALPWSFRAVRLVAQIHTH